MIVSVSRLQDIKEQKAICRHPSARRTSRVGGQVRAGCGRYRGFGVSVPVGRLRQAARRCCGADSADHSGAADPIVVARIAVRVPVRQPIGATAFPVQYGRAAIAFGAGLAIPAANIVVERHHNHRTVPASRRRRLQPLRFRAACRRELDRVRRCRR